MKSVQKGQETKSRMKQLNINVDTNHISLNHDGKGTFYLHEHSHRK